MLEQGSKLGLLGGKRLALNWLQLGLVRALRSRALELVVELAGLVGLR